MTDTPTPRHSRRSDRYRAETAAVESHAQSAGTAQTQPLRKVQLHQEVIDRQQQEAKARAAQNEPLTQQPYRRPARPAAQPGASAPAQPLRRQQAVSAAPSRRKVAEPVQPIRRQDMTPAVTRPSAQEEQPLLDRPRHAPLQSMPDKPLRPRMPLWMTTAIVLMVFALGAMVAAQSLMQAYLVQREQERAAAYQQVVDSHPIYFKDVIEKYAAENNLKPAFVAAIILNESSFRTNAESSVGARGLMQLMPDTAEWIAGKLDVTGYSFDRMYDAESNIRFGTWYLGYLSRLFRGDPVLVAAAYHAGQGQVNSWLSNEAMSKDGVTIDLENMIDGPTKSYAGRVTQAYAIYEALFYRTAGSAAADTVHADASGS